MRLLPFMFVFLISGCEQEEASPEFWTGYEAGCANGAVTGDFVKRQLGSCDLNDLESVLAGFGEPDGDYQRGRLDGYRECFIAHCEISLPAPAELI